MSDICLCDYCGDVIPTVSTTRTDVTRTTWTIDANGSPTTSGAVSLHYHGACYTKIQDLVTAQQVPAPTPPATASPTI